MLIPYTRHPPNPFLALLLSSYGSLRLRYTPSRWVCLGQCSQQWSGVLGHESLHHLGGGVHAVLPQLLLDPLPLVLRHLHAGQHPLADLGLRHGPATLSDALLHAAGHAPHAVGAEPPVELVPQVRVLLQPLTLLDDGDDKFFAGADAEQYTKSATEIGRSRMFQAYIATKVHPQAVEGITVGRKCS